MRPGAKRSLASLAAVFVSLAGVLAVVNAGEGASAPSPAAAVAPRGVESLIAAAERAGKRHDFAAQLRLAAAARRAEPGLVRPIAVLADAQIELGRYAEASRSIQRLLDLKPGLAAYARASYLRELRGDVAGAVAAMRLAVASAAGSPADSAWASVLLGDLELSRGRIVAAGDAYRAALRARPSYPQALRGLARIDLARGVLRRAVTRLRRASDLLPQPTTLTLLADAELAAGDRAAARAELAAARAQHRMLESSGTLPDADVVLFEADHGSPTAAVTLGRRVWRRAPSIRSADALGWALTRAGRPRDGLRFARRALATGSHDPLFNLHAAVAARRAGRPAGRQLALARRGVAALPPSARALACATYAPATNAKQGSDPCFAFHAYASNASQGSDPSDALYARARSSR